jgi:hypothetical protein
MSPSTDQLENLSQMTAILSGNRKASMLARSLWEFFNFELYCSIHDDDGQPNRHRIEGILDPSSIGDVRIVISLRRSARQEEGLVHELLHANLIPLGYPTFWIDEEQGSEKWQLAGGITNNAEHVVMLPIYLSLGCPKHRFLGASRPPTDQERRVIADLVEMSPNLSTPDGYLTHVSAYLQRQNVTFRALHLADAIVKKKI